MNPMDPYMMADLARERFAELTGERRRPEPFFYAPRPWQSLRNLFKRLDFSTRPRDRQAPVTRQRQRA